MLFQPTVVQLRGVDNKLYTLAGAGESSAAILLQPGAKGLDAPTFTLHEDEYPAIEGGHLRSARAGIREVFLPLKISATTRPEMMKLKRDFIASLNPTQGLVKLLFTEYAQPSLEGPLEAEPTKQLTCYYVSGMEGGEDASDGVNWSTYGLILHATDPYFRALLRTNVSFVHYDTLRPFIPDVGANPFLSLDGLTPGEGLALSTNPEWITTQLVPSIGNAEVRPRWTIRGPLNSTFSLRLHNAAGEVVKELRIHKPVSLGPDEVLTIETTRGELDVFLQAVDGTGPRTPLWSHFDISSDMWGLKPGDNQVTLQVDQPPNLTPEELEDWLVLNRPVVSLSYLPAYLGI
ncbi:hypothetical protein ACTMTF_15145 [Nonomuraea sp. ZG12]|uniref:hypothetical protein n=1 Tax=Nonomuraea sp. ZG12 TaxID=3452207 RepID=UPI003F8A369F